MEPIAGCAIPIVVAPVGWVLVGSGGNGNGTVAASLCAGCELSDGVDVVLSPSRDGINNELVLAPIPCPPPETDTEDCDKWLYDTKDIDAEATPPALTSTIPTPSLIPE